MSRDYGRLGANRRSSVAVWQWLIIGLVLGLGCSAVVVLGLLTFGVLGINLDGTGIAFGPTPTARVVTATVDISAPTITPVVMIVTATPEATSTPEESSVLAPTATNPVLETPTEEVEPTEEVAEPTESTTNNNGTSVQAAGEGAPQLEGVGSVLLNVEGGTFDMGTNLAEISAAVRQCTDAGGACTSGDAEDSQFTAPVTVDDFRIERTEVSYQQYVAFLNYLGPGSHTNGCGGYKCAEIQSEDPASSIVFDTQNYDVSTEFLLNYPVAKVTWYGANAYCQALGRRLPTEAEWERSARGPSNTLYPFGNDWNETLANAGKVGDAGEAPVAVDANPLGASGFQALNMAGNMAEWVNDWYLATYYNQFRQGENNNPTGPLSGVEKVIRGGSWADNPFFSRSVHRQSSTPDKTHAWVGFRCAADAETTSQTAPNTNSNTGSTTTTDPDATVDPATLGSDVTNEDDEAIGAPTLPSAPSEQTPVPSLPPGGD